VGAATLIGLAAGAFVFGAALGDGSAPVHPEPELAETLPLPRLAGQRMVIGLTGTSVPAGVERAIREGNVAGVILFAGNFPTRAVGRRLISQLQAIQRPPGLRAPLLIMVDQEGGQVKRLSGAPNASAAEMGARGAGFSREQGRRTAANLRDVGVNVDLAPVLDVARPGGVIAATERGFGSNAVRVANTAVAFAAALQHGGVAATGKHFPGLGAAVENTDFATQRIPLSKDELRRVDEAPYRRFSEMGGELVMLSTATYPAFSSKPAAFTRAIATGELRDRIGFEGVTITDALETVAVRAFGGPAEAGVAAAGAGADLLLFTDLADAERARHALVGALRKGRLDRGEFERAAQRVLKLRSSG
jgi:beta-N-acetylhexosaminidase